MIARRTPAHMGKSTQRRIAPHDAYRPANAYNTGVLLPALPDHPPSMLVLLHGALGASSQLHPLRDRLQGDHHLVVPDLAGHGPAPLGNASFTIGHFADQVAEAIAAGGGAPAWIFGYSMGGYVALHLAATRPELVAGVVTLGTRLAWSPEVADRECTQLDPVAIEAKVPRFAQTLAERHTAIGWTALLAHTATLLRGLGEHPLVTATSLAAVTCPVRLMLGDRDATATLGQTQEAMRQLPRGEMEVLPATPHPLERVSLDRLEWTLRQFMGS